MKKQIAFLKNIWQRHGPDNKQNDCRFVPVNRLKTVFLKHQMKSNTFTYLIFNTVESSLKSQHSVLKAVFMVFLPSWKKPPYVVSWYQYVFWSSPPNSGTSHLPRQKEAFVCICCAWLRTDPFFSQNCCCFLLINSLLWCKLNT